MLTNGFPPWRSNGHQLTSMWHLVIGKSDDVAANANVACHDLTVDDAMVGDVWRAC